ncbi:type VI secretion system protein TssA [Ideonella sp. YS5]|uniref:type VI secretion system protein TssA n=1 Tax=Ideonella sp. YS5 TaxID=3453714 RepID=UPI003EE945CD
MHHTDFLTPLASSSPCGEDLSFSPEFDAIQEMRRADDPSLDQGEWVTDLKVADWPGVARTCEELLSTRTKDLRVAGWLVDAWARLRGFTGLHDGLALCVGLVEQHWHHLHPLPDDGDQEQRIGNLTWLLARVEELARQVSLATPTATGFSLIDLEATRAARAHGTGTDASARAEQATKELAAIARAISSAGLAAFDLQRAAIEGCQAELVRLQALVDELLAHTSPSFGPARRALEAARDAWLRLGRDSGITAAEPGSAPANGSAQQAASAEPASGIVATASAAPAMPGVLTSRSQALHQLRQVADYFRRTEPHSPVTYLADKAARWGDMPLHAWLRAVVKDSGALAQLEDLLGMERPPAESN